MENLITFALLTSSKQEQEQAQTKILQIQSSNPVQYLSQCTNIISDDTKTDQLRQGAGTLLSSAILIIVNNEETQFSYWDYASPEVKKNIKSKLLETLVSRSHLAEKAAAQAIASICSIEIPRGQWLDLIPILVNIINGQDLNAMATAVMTLGLISSQFGKSQKKPLPKQCEQILTGIVVGLNKSDEIQNTQIKKTCLSALRDSLHFLSNLLQNQNARNHIFRTIVTGIRNHQTKEVSVQALGQFCKYAYIYLRQYIPQLLQVLDEVIRFGDSNSSAGIEIWNTIGQQYLDRTKAVGINSQNSIENHLLLVHQILSQLLMQQATRPLKDLGDQEIRRGAIFTLATLATACGQICFQKIINFTANTVKHEDENLRQASVTVFAALVQAKPQQKIIQFFRMGISHFVKTINDSSKMVIKSSLQGWERIFTVPAFSYVFFQDSNHVEYIKQFISYLKVSSSAQVQQIQNLVLLALIQLFQNMKLEINQQTNKLVFSLLQTLTNFAFESGNNVLIDYSLSCVINILKFNLNYELCYHFLMFVIGKLENLNTRSMALIDGCMGVINIGIRKMTSIQINLEFMDKIYGFIVNYFKTVGGVHENGLDLIGALAYSYKKKFQKHMPEAQNYLFSGLSNYKDKAVFKSALLCLSDISMNLPSYMKKHFHLYMDLLVKGMESQIDRQSKITILDTIGDCIGSSSSSVQPYLMNIIGTLLLCFKASFYRLNDREYNQQLRACIIRLESSLFYNINDEDNINPLIKNHFPDLLSFIFATTKMEENPTVNYLRECVQLAYYCADMYNLKSMINNQEFRAKLEVLKQFTSTEEGLQEVLMGINKGLNRPY